MHMQTIYEYMKYLNEQLNKEHE